MVFADHVALPFKIGFARVYRELADHGLHEKVVLIGSGRLGRPENALLSFALGADMINVARESMLAIGCIQAQRCHTDRCPTGVATHNPWLMRGLDPTLNSERLAAYVATLRKELLRLAHACGRLHPGLVGPEQIEILDGRYGSATAGSVFGYGDGLGFPGAADRAEIERIMANAGSAG